MRNIEKSTAEKGKRFTSESCFSVISTPSRSVFRSGAAPDESLDVSIFEKLSLTTEEALPKLSATSSRLFAKFCNTIPSNKSAQDFNKDTKTFTLNGQH